MKIKGKKVLVTGADGFIGSHLCEELVRQGACVCGFVFYNSFGSHGWLDSLSAEVSREIKVCVGDIRDPHHLQQALTGSQIIFHLAALIGIPYSYHSPDSYVDTNIKGTLNLLQAVRKLDVEKVVHTSTSEVYGTAQQIPIDEKHPLHAQSPYAATKIGADQLALSFYHSFKTPVSILRPFNTYGPRQSTRAVIPSIITQIAKGNNRVVLGNTTTSRDFVFVKDTVRAFIAAAEEEASLGKTVHVGSGFEILIKELALEIGDLMGVKVEIAEGKERYRPANSEVLRLLANISLAKQILHWEPQYGGLDGLRRGLKENIEWFTNPNNLQKYTCNDYQI
jgi:NAD dependent epimerase/dehydratase